VRDREREEEARLEGRGLQTDLDLLSKEVKRGPETDSTADESHETEGGMLGDETREVLHELSRLSQSESQ
jgi:hypothetical protein